MRKKPTTADRIMWDYEQEKREKNKPKRNIPYDPETYALGKEWSMSGKKLEEAPETMRNNFNFVNGFNHGERLKMIAEMDSAPKTR